MSHNPEDAAVPTSFELFATLVNEKASMEFGNQTPDCLALDWLALLDTTGAKIGNSKSIAKAYFEMANSRHEIVKFAQANLDLFWTPAVKMEHPFGLPRVLGLHPSLISTANGFSVFMDYPEDQRPQLLQMARTRNLDGYVSSLTRLMASGTLNTYHAHSFLTCADTDPFTDAKYTPLLIDLVAGNPGGLQCSDRNKCAVIEIMWLTGQKDLAKDLLQIYRQTSEVDPVTSLQSILQSCFMTGNASHVRQVTTMAEELYKIDETDNAYDLALARLIESPMISRDVLHHLLVERARQAHELGSVEQIKAWLPDYLSRNAQEVRNIHGSPLLWTILALNPTWIAKKSEFAESMADPVYLNGCVSFTGTKSWRELAELSASEEGALFWMLQKLDTAKVKKLGLAEEVVSMFLKGVSQERKHLDDLGNPEATTWERMIQATEDLARNLGAYCKVRIDEKVITAVFDALGQPRYQKAFLEPLPRFPELLGRLPGREVDRLMEGDLGL